MCLNPYNRRADTSDAFFHFGGGLSSDDVFCLGHVEAAPQGEITGAGAPRVLKEGNTGGSYRL